MREVHRFESCTAHHLKPLPRKRLRFFITFPKVGSDTGPVAIAVDPEPCESAIPRISVRGSHSMRFRTLRGAAPEPLWGLRVE